VELVLTILSITPGRRREAWNRGGGDLSDKGGLSPYRNPWRSRLLSNYIVAAREQTLQTRGIPEKFDRCLHDARNHSRKKKT